MKVDKGVSTWMICGFYIQCLKELTFFKSNIYTLFLFFVLNVIDNYNG